MRQKVQAAAAIAVGLAMTGAAADASVVDVDLSALNPTVAGSGLNVSGTAMLDYDGASTLKVSVEADGLVPDVQHAQHIHGVIGGKSRSPVASDDADNDGVLELFDAFAAYGDIIVPLVDLTTMEFPTADSSGHISFSETYDLTDPAVFNSTYTKADLLPLRFREIVLHGAILDPGVGIDFGRDVEEADGGPGGYQPLLPVATGQIPTVPVPAAGLLLLGGLGGLAAFRRRAA